MGAHISIFHCSAFDGKNIEVTDAIINFIDEKAKASKTNLNGNLNLKQGIFFILLVIYVYFKGGTERFSIFTLLPSVPSVPSSIFFHAQNKNIFSPSAKRGVCYLSSVDISLSARLIKHFLPNLYETW